MNTAVTLKQIETHLGKKFAYSTITKDEDSYMSLNRIVALYGSRTDRDLIKLIVDCKKDQVDKLRSIARHMLKSIYPVVYDYYNKGSDTTKWEIIAIDKLYDAFDRSESNLKINDTNKRKDNFDKLYSSLPTIDNAHPLVYLRRAMHYYIHHDNDYFINNFHQIYSNLIWINTVITFENKEFKEFFK